MPTSPRSPRHPWLVLAVSLAWIAGCAGGSSDGDGDSSDLSVEQISVTQDAPWKINRPIDIEFNKDVDIATVSLNTITIQNVSGITATGSFGYAPRADGSLARNVIRFQPTCPKRADNSDAGLRPGTTYTLHVLGSTSGGVTVLATDGSPVTLSRSVTFSTPVGNAQALFLDTVPGAPQPVVRGLAGVPTDEVNATYLELGDDPNDRVYFELNFATQRGELPAGFEVPQNLYSVSESQVAVVVFFNQPVQGTPDNLNGQRLRLEYNTSGGLDDWLPIVTSVELLENCTEVGSAVRLEPVGLLPQDSALRVNVRQGFAQAGN